MNIKETLLKNGYSTENIADAILEMDNHNCENVRELGNNKFDLFEGYELTGNTSILITINTEKDSEFAPIAIFTLDDDKFISTETGYDNNGNIIYTVKDGVVQ